MELNTIKAKPSKSKKRVGRGIGSGKGKTSGRGHKGQKSRSGVAIKSFEGGQMPLYRRLPKRGFKSMNNKKTFAIINLSIIQNILDSKKIPTDSKINLDTLKKIKRVGNKYNKLKLLGSGNIKEKINFELNSISKSAKEKIEKLGGKVILIK